MTLLSQLESLLSLNSIFGPPYTVDVQALRDAVKTAEEIPALRSEIEGLKMDLEAERGPHCEGCGQPIDPTTCWCGDYIEGHGMNGIDSGVPMGCICGYYERDWKRIAQGLQKLLWKAKRPAVFSALEAMSDARIEVKP